MFPKNGRRSPKMSTVEFFCQDTMQNAIAPRSVGSVKTRITVAARALGWSCSRAKDAWYADPRIKISPEELFRVEAVSGLTYARQEMRENDEAIARADALLGGKDSHLIREIVAAVCAKLGLSHRT
jgi:hypothetical protein